MAENTETRLERLLTDAIESREIPGAVAAIGVGPDVRWQYVGGYAVLEGRPPLPMQETTRFDLASLTKVMATLPAILELAGSGVVTLDDPVGLFLPGFQDGLWQDVTIKRLLTHTAGLAPTKPYFETTTGLEDFLNAIRISGLELAPGRQVVYSDLGYILLGAVVSRVTGRPFDEWVRESIWLPLGLTETRYGPIAPDLAAATEVIQGFPLQGTVHDENARALGGISGHAGVFAPLRDVIRYIQAWCDPDHPWLSGWIRQQSVSCHTTGLGGRRGLGWVLRGDAYDVAGDFWPETTVSHTGFTGTSVVWDGPSRCWAVLLTNRVHLGRDRNIGRLRRRFHNVAAQLLAR
ncbi:MAG: serine hydrolase [Sulfobacillus sp.]|nr:serine hydrolase [Sulfobacillus sp.]